MVPFLFFFSTPPPFLWAMAVTELMSVFNFLLGRAVVPGLFGRVGWGTHGKDQPALPPTRCSAASPPLMLTACLPYPFRCLHPVCSLQRRNQIPFRRRTAASRRMVVFAFGRACLTLLRGASTNFHCLCLPTAGGLRHGTSPPSSSGRVEGVPKDRCRLRRPS